MTVQVMRHNMKRLQENWHRRCVACSSRNPQGLHLEFMPGEGGRIEAAFPCDTAFQGYDGCLHGGLVAMLLDAAMTNCMFAHGILAVTAEFRLRFYQPVVTGKPDCVRAWLESSSHRLHLARAELIQDGAARVAASGKFIESDPASTRAGRGEN